MPIKLNSDHILPPQGRQKKKANDTCIIAKKHVNEKSLPTCCNTVK